MYIHRVHSHACAFEQVEHAGTTSLIGIGHNMAIRLKHNSTRITARTAKHSGNHPHKEQTFIGQRFISSPGEKPNMKAPIY